MAREEACLEEWGELYAAAERIRDRKPWEQFWDLDLIGVRDGSEEDTVFFSILGRGGETFGICAYEGYEALNSFMLLTLQDELNVSAGQAMFAQECLVCYWGDREELSEKERKRVRELGYQYRGRKRWLYFVSYQPGFYPYSLDREEVLRMTRLLKDLEFALAQYEETGAQVDFAGGKMYLVEFEKGREGFHAGEKELPLDSYRFGNLIIEDEEILEKLRKAPRCGAVLEADVRYMGERVVYEEYERPVNPRVCLVAEAEDGLILHHEFLGPEEDAGGMLAEEIAGFILQCGAPREIRVADVIQEAALEQICQVCGIRLRRVKRLRCIEDFWRGIKTR